MRLDGMFLIGMLKRSAFIIINFITGYRNRAFVITAAIQDACKYRFMFPSCSWACIKCHVIDCVYLPGCVSVLSGMLPMSQTILCFSKCYFRSGVTSHDALSDFSSAHHYITSTQALYSNQQMSPKSQSLSLNEPARECTIHFAVCAHAMYAMWNFSPVLRIYSVHQLLFLSYSRWTLLYLLLTHKGGKTQKPCSFFSFAAVRFKCNYVSNC